MATGRPTAYFPPGSNNHASSHFSHLMFHWTGRVLLLPHPELSSDGPHACKCLCTHTNTNLTTTETLHNNIDPRRKAHRNRKFKDGYLWVLSKCLSFNGYITWSHSKSNGIWLCSSEWMDEGRKGYGLSGSWNIIYCRMKMNGLRWRSRNDCLCRLYDVRICTSITCARSRCVCAQTGDATYNQQYSEIGYFLATPTSYRLALTVAGAEHGLPATFSTHHNTEIAFIYYQPYVHLSALSWMCFLSNYSLFR